MANTQFGQINLPPIQRGTNQFGTNNNVGLQPIQGQRSVTNGMGTDPVSILQNTITGGVQGPNPYAQASADALGGLGAYLNNLGGAKQNANLENNQQQGALSGLIQRQGENQQNNADSVLRQSPAGYDIDPYARMALTRALVGSFTTPQVGPGGASGGINISALAPVMNQYYNDNAIRESMTQQQRLRSQVDPRGPLSQAGNQIYAPGEFDGNFADMQNTQAGAMQERKFNEDTSQQALRDAIAGNNKSAKGSAWGAIGSAVLKGLPSLLGLL